VADRPQARDDLELAAWHLEALYGLDERGDLVRVLGSGNPEPPLVHLVTTRAGNDWRFHARLPSAVRARLEPLLAAEPTLSAEGRPRCTDAVRAALEEAGYRVDGEYSGPCFVLPTGLETPTGVVEVTAANEGAMARYFDGPWSDLEASQPMFAILDGDDAVSLCFVARPSPGVAAEAGVETAEMYRRRGFASRVVRAWVVAVDAGGRLPIYSTSWDNEASRRIASGLGGRWYGVDTQWASAVMLP